MATKKRAESKEQADHLERPKDDRKGKKRQRGHGEGTISQLPDGRWWARVDLGYVNGKRQRKAYYGKTRREVADELKKVLAKQQDGLPILSNERQTVAQFLEHWLEHSARDTLRPSTFARYCQLVRRHTVPSIGNVPLTKLTPQQIAGLYHERRKAGLSARTVQFLHAVLHRAFRQAVKWEVLGRNPTDAVDAPRPERKDIHPLTPEQGQVFLATVEGDPLEALYVLALTTGMRIGELLGLRWQDLAGNRLQVCHTLQWLGGKWELLEPKTDRSRRSIRLSALALAAFRRHRVAQNERRLAAGPLWAGLDLVFCDAVGQPLRDYNVLRSSFRPLLAKAGLPTTLRLHDLRHSCATALMAQGVHPKKVQELLGHCTISLTMDTYSHVFPDMQDEIADTMDRLFAAR